MKAVLELKFYYVSRDLRMIKSFDARQNSYCNTHGMAYLGESNPRFPYKSTVNIILMKSLVYMLKQSKNS